MDLSVRFKLLEEMWVQICDKVRMLAEINSRLLNRSL